ncbi:NACHT, LRR and PYD domains-containing protein 7 [Chionoecetes opilio]|uniref:NACHT, LRR and PYD domains-containing protein 7 n=1 Tax=Chionoecetes opilio TaxID=41210 RepID=A0A8J4XSS0_CHIOP|nr:NACHT, LRR and PYD domains-containing protein 7 [Chionoecetes opilio]
MQSLRSSIIELQNLSYTRQDLCFGKYFKAVNKIGTIVLACTFKLIYQSPETDSGRLSIQNYCLTHLKWSTTTYNKVFNSTERQVLNASPNSDEFVCDVSLWFKLLMNVLRTVVEPIKEGIRELKNLRNAVCHEDLMMNDQELHQRLVRLSELCRDVLENAQLLVPDESRASMCMMIAEVETRLRDLMGVEVEANDIHSYLEDLGEFRQKKTSKMIREGRKELMSHYLKMKILNPCPWLNDNRFSDFTVENTFTSLKLQESGAIVPMNDILNLSELKQRFVPQLVIVSGVMGAGKTSFYRYLLHEWCSRSSVVTGLSAVDIVIGLEMRWLTCGSLVQYLREQLLKDTSRLFSESDIIPVLQEMNVLFIIDGMDEATRHGRALLREVITKFTNSTIIVTTRPEFTLELMKMAEEHIVLQIEGFTLENQKEFVKKVFAIKYPEKRRFQKEVGTFLAYKNSVCASLSSHLSLPLNIALLLVLWCDDYLKVTAVTTTTRLYCKIYEMSQQKLTQRLENGGGGHSASIGLKVRRCLIELGRIAWTMMLEESLCLTQQHTINLMEFCEREGIEPIQALSTFLNSETKETLTGTICDFSFHHSSSEEFLAALYVSEEVATTGSLFPLLNDVNTPRFQEIVMYTTGLLKLKGILTPPLASEIKEVLSRCLQTQINDPHVLHRLIQEANGDASVCEIVGSIISAERSWVINSWDLLELTEAKRNLMRQTHAAPAHVDIYTQYTKKLEDCPELEDIIRLLGKINVTKVRVFVDRQFHAVSEQDQADNLLMPLLISNTLLAFIGHVGLVFTSGLVHATNLQSLSVRITSLEALVHMSQSIKKHRHWKARIMPSKKWALKKLVLFLDISKTIPPPEIPFLHYRKDLQLKLSGVTDEDATWAGQVVHRLNRSYASLTLQTSHLSPAGYKHFLKATRDVTIKVLRVMSDKLDLREDSGAYGRRGTRIELGIL